MWIPCGMWGHGKVLDLGPDEWKDFGGFPQLSWSHIKVKNQEFISHVEQGLWSV